MAENRFKQFIGKIFRRGTTPEVQTEAATMAVEDSPTNEYQEPVASLEQVRRAWVSRQTKLIQESSPYAKDIEKALERGDHEHIDTLTKEERIWADDILSYQADEEKTGLLSEAAKSCLENDFGPEKSVVNILDCSRGDQSMWAMDFNEAVESGDSNKIRLHADLLLNNSRHYEFEKYQAMNIDSSRLKVYLSPDFQTPRERLVSEVSKKSPYLRSIEKSKSLGHWHGAEMLESQSELWAQQQAGYLLQPEVKGLLNNQAKQCLIEDYGIPKQVIELFDMSREGYTHNHESLNHAVEHGTSTDIFRAVNAICDHVEDYEYERLDKIVQSTNLDWDEIHYDINFHVTPKTSAERVQHEAKSSPLLSSESSSKLEPSSKLRTAPVISNPGEKSEHDNPLLRAEQDWSDKMLTTPLEPSAKLRVAPMMESAKGETARGLPNQVEPDPKKGVSR